MERREYQESQFGFATLPVAPPFSFTGMTTRLFPLRASRNALQSYCDRYLNIVPPEIGRFRVALPYVYLMMVDYGRMSSSAANLGWIAQHEVAFAVPLEWYRVIDGRWTFHDWAWNMPFIFVDEGESQSLGRMVYGWPKVLVHFDEEPSLWLQRPREQETVASVSAAVFTRLYAGASQRRQVFLRIVRDTASPFTRLPPDLRSPASPFMALPNAAQAVTDALAEAWRLAAGLANGPTAPGDRLNNLALMGRTLAGMASPLAPDLHCNTVNLKQFRSASMPEFYCYQALTNARMALRAFNGGGPLGEGTLLGADRSGGYTVELKSYPSLPIVEVLGLEVDRWRRDGNVDVASIRPVAPLWYNADLDYNTGHNLAWRTDDTRWRDEWGRTYPPRAEEKRRDEWGRAAPARVEPPRYEDRLFNTTLGVSASPAAGEFLYKGLTLRVLPLAADRATLRAYIDQFYNKPLVGNPGEYTLDLWDGDSDDHDTPAYVYLVVSSCKERLPRNNLVGSWPECALSFMIPVVLRGTVDGVKIETLGLVPTFTFNDSPTSVILSTEVDGIPAIVGDFAVAAHKWMTERGPSPSTAEPFVEVKSDQIPIFGEGQEATRRCVIEVGSTCSTPVRDARASAAQTRAARETPDLFREARSRALDVLAESSPFRLFTLKQLRDIERPNDACYQALVCIYRAFHSQYTAERIETPLYVRLHDYPAASIVTRLGLRHYASEPGGGTTVYTVAAVDPFWISTTSLELKRDVICHRAGDEAWSPGPDEPHFLDAFRSKVVPAPPTPTAQAAQALRGFESVWRSWQAEAVVHLGRRKAEPDKFTDDDNDADPGDVGGRITLKPGRPGPEAPTLHSIASIPPQAILHAALDLELPDPAALKRWIHDRRTVRQRFSAARGDPAEMREIAAGMRAELEAANIDVAARACLRFERFAAAAAQCRTIARAEDRRASTPALKKLRALVEEDAPGAESPRVAWVWTQLRGLIPDASPDANAVEGACKLVTANLRHALDDLVDDVARAWAQRARRSA
jgi:hypothetical protein